MHYRKMGRTGLKVSVVCLGTMLYGAQVGETEAVKIIESALASGINFLDTADTYLEGRSEEIVGKAIENKRSSVVLATKVAFATGPGVNDVGLTRKHIMTAIEDSLHRLKTDYIDVYYVHVPDYVTPIEETLRTLDDLIKQGKVRYIGCSNFRAWQLCKALWVSNLNNLARFDCIQSPYNLLTRDAEYELLPLCASEAVGVCVYNPLAGGLLTGKYDPNKIPTKDTRFGLQYITPTNRPWGQVYHERYWSAENFEAIARLKQIAEEHSRNLAQFSLAWVLSNETITSAVCGVTSLKQLEANLKATEIELLDEELVACNDVWQTLSPPRFSYGR